MTYDPSVLQRHHVVNVHVAGSTPCSAVVRARPRSSRGGASGVDHDAGSIPLEHVFTVEGYQRVRLPVGICGYSPGIAGAGHSLPVREEVTVVGIRVCPGRHREASKKRLGSGCSRNAGLRMIS